MKLKLLLVPIAAAAMFAASSKLPEPGAMSLVRVPNGGIQPQAVADSAGVVHLLYFAGDPKHGDLFYVKSRDYGATWSSPVRVNSKPGAAIAVGTIRGGQLAVGKNGRVHVAWNGSSVTEVDGPMNPARALSARCATRCGAWRRRTAGSSPAGTG